VRYIRQTGKKDCGVAALAMLCDVSYEDANRVIPWRRVGLLYGTTTRQLREGALRLGYATESTPSNRLKVVRSSHDDPNRMWEDIPSNSLVKIGDTVRFDNMWHWVVWNKGKIYDPARGVFRPAKYNRRPYSYMRFFKREVET